MKIKNLMISLVLFVLIFIGSSLFMFTGNTSAAASSTATVTVTVQIAPPEILPLTTSALESFILEINATFLQVFALQRHDISMV